MKTAWRPSSDLAGEADILLNNYRPGVMDKLGLGSDISRAANPRLINVAVTGFGTIGPLAHRPAYDHVIQGISGLTGMQGGTDPETGDSYDFIKMLICDKVTAYTVAQGHRRFGRRAPRPAQASILIFPCCMACLPLCGPMA